MKHYKEMTSNELMHEYKILTERYKQLKAQGLNLNMARGKPGPEQLDLAMPLLDVMNSASNCYTEDGIDCRNYGELAGINEAKQLFGDYMGVAPNEIFIAGSSSLTLMYDCITRAVLTGVLDSDKPWGHKQTIKFLCPVPGYDRHFSICEFLGIEMINIPMNESGPDMDMVEQLTARDETIKGIWCVPKYSNPLGITYADETVRRLAAMPARAKDFRIFWDNAYAVHGLDQDTILLNILTECKKAGHPNRVYMFGSTNKITFPGAGVAFMAASADNIRFTKKQLSMQAIGWDKLNMLRHVRFFKNIEGIRSHMKLHAQILKPKFDLVSRYLENELKPIGAGTFYRPDGGYFITYLAEPGCAGQIVSRCREAGVILTNAGATHPYGRDPQDRYIRIAPSFPSCQELETAMEIFVTAAKLVTVSKYIKTR